MRPRGRFLIPCYRYRIARIDGVDVIGVGPQAVVAIVVNVVSPDGEIDRSHVLGATRLPSREAADRVPSDLVVSDDGTDRPVPGQP